MALILPVVVKSVIQPVQWWPGGSSLLVARSSFWNGNIATLNLLLPDGLTNLATSLTASADGITAAAVSLPGGKVVVTGLAAPVTVGTVVITGTAGQFSCAASTLAVGNYLTLSGTYGGTGSIAGYASPTVYKISVTNGTTTFTLTDLFGNALVTAAGTPSGLTYTLGNIDINLQAIPTNLN